VSSVANRIAALEASVGPGGECVCGSWPPLTIADLMRHAAADGDEPASTPWLKYLECPRCGRENALKPLLDSARERCAERNSG
jgi:hypothetical protein